MKRPHRISPALREQAMESLTDLGPKEGIINPPLRLIHVKFGRHHIEIASEYHPVYRSRGALRRARPID